MADERGWTTAPVHRSHACLLVFVAFHGARLSRLASTISLQAMRDGCLHTVAPCRCTADACRWPAATCRVWRASLPVERAVRASCVARVLPAYPLPREPISCRPPGCGRCTPCRPRAPCMPPAEGTDLLQAAGMWAVHPVPPAAPPSPQPSLAGQPLPSLTILRTPRAPVCGRYSRRHRPHLRAVPTWPLHCRPVYGRCSTRADTARSVTTGSIRCRSPCGIDRMPAPNEWPTARSPASPPPS